MQIISFGLLTALCAFISLPVCQEPRVLKESEAALVPPVRPSPAMTSTQVQACSLREELTDVNIQQKKIVLSSSTAVDGYTRSLEGREKANMCP